MKNNKNFKKTDNVSKESVTFDMAELISLVKHKQSKNKLEVKTKQSISDDNNLLGLLNEEEYNDFIDETSKEQITKKLNQIQIIEKELNTLFIELVKKKKEEDNIKENIDILRQELLRAKGFDYLELEDKDYERKLAKIEEKEDKKSNDVGGLNSNESDEIDSMEEVREIESFFRLNKCNVENEKDIDLYLINRKILSLKGFIDREKMVLDKYITASVAIMSSLGVGFLVTGNMIGLGLLVASVTLFLILRVYMFRNKRMKVFNMIKEYQDTLRLAECFNINYEGYEISLK